MAQRTVLPPPVAGTRSAAARDAFPLTAWMLRGYAYGLKHGQRRSRVTSLVTLLSAGSGLLVLLAALVWFPRWLVPAIVAAVAMSALIPVLMWFQIVVSRATAWYMLDAAAIAVIASTDGWKIANHLSAHPGSGAGRPLRALVFPVLIIDADRLGIPLIIEAADARLAEVYLAEIPGLRAVGPGTLSGVRLRRQPRASALNETRGDEADPCASQSSRGATAGISVTRSSRSPH